MRVAPCVQVEAQVVQLGELKACLEAELADVYADRDRLVAEMEQVGKPPMPMILLA